MKIPIVIVLTLIVLSFGQQNKRSLIAVFDFNESGVTKSEAKTISDNLSSELLVHKKFRLLERGQMEKILQEQGFQESGLCDESSCQMEMGKLLGVEKVIVGSVGKVGRTYTLTAKIISLETGEIELSAKEFFTGEIDGLLLTSTPRLGKKLSGIEVPEMKKSVLGNQSSLPKITGTPEQNNLKVQKALLWIKVSTGLLAVGSGAAAYYYSSKVSSYNKNAKNAKSPEDQDQAIKDSEKSADLRTVYTSISAFSLLGFGLSFAF